MNKKILGIVAVAAAVIVGGAFWFKSINNDSIENKGSTAIEITHDLGTTTIESTPERVVVLDLGALDILDELGVNIIGVPQSAKMPDYLSKYASSDYSNVGSVKEPNLEAINELNPDLIVMASRMGDYYEEFSKIAPTIYVESDGARYMETFTTTVENFGKIFNEEDKAKEMINTVNTNLNEVKDKINKLDTNASVVMVNGRAISGFGAASRFGMIFNELGFVQADSNLLDSTHGQEVSYEYLVEKNPGYLFVVDRNSITGSNEIKAQSVIENELIKQTDAYKNKNIVYLNSINWYTVSGGYTSTLNMIEEIKINI